MPCFHHVGIHKNFQKYLGVSWRGISYVWTVLPFGAACSPYFLTELLKWWWYFYIKMTFILQHLWMIFSKWQVQDVPQITRISY